MQIVLKVEDVLAVLHRFRVAKLLNATIFVGMPLFGVDMSLCG